MLTTTSGSRSASSASPWDSSPRPSATLFREEPEALALLRGLETGELDEAAFEPRFAALLGVDDHEGLIGAPVRRARPRRGDDRSRARRAGGRSQDRTDHELVGLGIYDRAPVDLFDATVISGDVGLHKPQPEIYRLACERLGVGRRSAVFVDDLRENVAGAEAVGMAAVLHRDSAATIAELERLLGLPLRYRPTGRQTLFRDLRSFNIRAGLGRSP